MTFLSFLKSADTENLYIEVFGLDWEQFAPRQIFCHRPGITISQQDNKNEALETINFAMVHYDANYAQQTEWQQCLVVSTLTLQKIIGASWKTFARKKRILNFEYIKMLRPVFDGDTLYAESEILNVERNNSLDTGNIYVETRGINQHGDIVAKIRYTANIYRKNKHPYYQTLNVLNEQDHEQRFTAYHKNNEKLTEHFGFFFEELQPNEQYQHALFKNVFPTDAVQSSLRALNWDPAYTNPWYNENYLGHPLKLCEAYLLGICTTPTTRLFGKVVANLAWENINFHQAVFPQDRLQIISKIMHKRHSQSRPDQGIIQVENIICNQKNEMVLTFERTFLIYKKATNIYKNSGY